MRPPTLRHFADRETLDAKLAAFLGRFTADAALGTHAIILAGGSTPMPAYRSLAAKTAPAPAGLHLGFTDERLVHPDSPDSNLGNTLPLIEALALPDERVFTVPHELAPDAAAAAYGDALRDFSESGGSFSLAVLGMGSDGHTCSLFNITDAEEEDRWAIPVTDRPDHPRVSITRRVLKLCDKLLFVVAGENKADILVQFIADPLSTPAGCAVAGHPAIEIWTELSRKQ